MSAGAQGSVESIPLQSDRERALVERAVDIGEYDDVEAFVREATLRLVDEILDGSGILPCPHDNCARTFATRRQLRGHLGGSEHALDVPDGDFWCGYCGRGPLSWRGVNAHHGSTDHDGPPIRLDEEPAREDLVAPDDVPDHRNPELLARLYHEHDGNCSEMCRQHDFDVTSSRVRHYLIEFGIHEVTPQGATDADDGPVYRDPEWLQERYDRARGNVSEMHRRIKAEDIVDIPYRTLLKNLKNFGIHEPDERRSQNVDERNESREPSSASTTADVDDETENVPETDPEAQPDRDAPVDTPEEAVSSGGNGDEDVDVDVRAIITVDNPDEVDSFADLATPSWLDEGSFFSAVDMADDVDELAEVLGWHEPEQLTIVVDLLDLDVKAERREVVA